MTLQAPISERPLNLEGRFSESHSEFELEGDQQALMEFAFSLRSQGQTLRLTLRLPPPESVAPYDEALSAIDVVPADGRIRYQRVGTVLQIAGDSKSLDLLACEMEFLASAGPTSTGVQRHSHIDYWDDHLFLAPGSE